MTKDEKRLASDLEQAKLLLRRYEQEATRLQNTEAALRLNCVCLDLQVAIQQLEGK